MIGKLLYAVDRAGFVRLHSFTMFLTWVGVLLFIRTMPKLFLFVKLTEPLNLDLRNNFKLFPDIIQHNKNERDSDNRFRGCFWFYTTRFSVQLEAANVAHTAKSKLIPQICKLFSLSDYVLFYMLFFAAIQILRILD